MKTLPAIPLLILATTGCASNPGNPPVCGGEPERDSETTRTLISVQLKPRTSAPMLYWSSDHYAILMTPDAVRKLLESWVAKDHYSRHTPTLLDWIEADMPLADDTDLQKYTLRNTGLESLPRYIAAALLEAGEASIIDLWEVDDDKNLSEMELLRLENGAGEWRYFCGPSGQEILGVNDSIVALPAQSSPGSRLELARIAGPARHHEAILHSPF